MVDLCLNFQLLTFTVPHTLCARHTGLISGPLSLSPQGLCTDCFTPGAFPIAPLMPPCYPVIWLTPLNTHISVPKSPTQVAFPGHSGGARSTCVKAQNTCFRCSFACSLWDPLNRICFFPTMVLVMQPVPASCLPALCSSQCTSWHKGDLCGRDAFWFN